MRFLMGCLLVTMVLSGCKKDPVKELGIWTIPKAEVKDGGPGKDGILALENPSFIESNEVDFMAEKDLVLAYASDNDIRVYTHRVLDWHEIINDDLGDDSYALTYCPLTGTGIVWDRKVAGVKTTFGVSGLLYNSNVIPYDRATDSNWSQMKLECVNGESLGAKPNVLPLLETSWKTWKEMYPSSKVLSDQTGMNRTYDSYPYGDYKTNDSSILFSVSNEDARLNNKERVLGLVSNNNAKIFQFSDFDADVSLKQDEFNGIDYVVIGSAEKEFMVAYGGQTATSGKLTFSIIQNDLPTIMIDNENNKYDVFGRVVEGDRLGERLDPLNAFMGYWFAFAAFYPDLVF